MRSRKRNKGILAVLLIICIAVLSSCSVKQNSSYEITDGIKLGMKFNEVIETTKKAHLDVNDYLIFETTVADQPYTNVYLGFVDSIDKYDPTVSGSDLKKDTAHFMLLSMGMDYGLYMMNEGFSDPINVDKYDSNKVLAQVYATFTSDLNYSTAEETFATVEEYLDKKYGETRYTSKRGESLPEVYGYESIPSVVFMGTGINGSVPYYTHRKLELDNGQSLVIDHHIVTYTKKQTFSHQLGFTLVPKQ